MHLYIIAGRINIDISDVTLVDGYRPSVGGFRPSSIDFEPAIWFKVMVLDAVTIDCDERRLSWIPLCDSAISNFAALDSGIALCGSYRLSSSSSSDDQHHLISCTDDSLYCRLDEAFDIVSDLLGRYEQDEVKREDFNEQLTRLLHIHVLPNIKLTVQDTDCIVACVHALELMIGQIDRDILEIAEKIGLAQQSLTNLRMKLLSEFMSDDRKTSSSSLFSPDFIALLLSKKGIEKDIETAWAAVEHAQIAVENLKENPGVSDADLLSRRAERDHVTAEYEKLLTAREKLKEMRRGKRGIMKRVKTAIASVREDPQHKIYAAIISKLNDFEKLNEIITHKKLLVTSVKEAARLTLKDLQSGSDSFGMDVDYVGAAHSTNVLGGEVKPPWQSLAEQVASLLGNKSHPIAKLHRHFCRHIADVCSATAIEKKLCDESIQALQYKLRCSAELKTDIHNNSSLGSRSECELDMNSVLIRPNSAPSLPEDHRSQLAKVKMQVERVASKRSSLAQSLPLPESLPIESSNGGGLGIRSFSFCSTSTIDQKQEILTSSGSSKKGKRATLTPSFKSYVQYGLISVSSKDSNKDSPVLIVDTNKDCVQVALESIRKDILDHFARISEQLQQELTASAVKSQYQQIWLDYESHFYHEMMAPLTGLYQLQYASVTEAFCNSLLTLTPSDLSLDDAVLVDLLQDRDEEAVFSLENCTLSNRDRKVSNCTESTSRGSTSSKYEDAAGAKALLEVASKSQVNLSDEADELSRLLRYHSENRKRPQLRTVRISLPVINVPHSPTSVLVYERTLAPLPSECGSLYNRQLSLSASTMILKPRYRLQFASALKHIELAVEARTPGSKLRCLTDCLRETTHQLAAFYAELYGDSSSQSSCDELLDAVVILLCNIDGHQMAMLYCQLSLLADMMAPWLIRGPYSFTLVQFTGACQFIQERLMLKRNRHISKQSESLA